METKTRNVNENALSNEDLVAGLSAVVDRLKTDERLSDRPERHMRIGQSNFAVRVTPELKEEFNAACKKRGVSSTLAIKELMSDFISRQ